VRPNIAYEHEVAVVPTCLPSGGEIVNRGLDVVRNAFSHTPVSSAALVYLTSAGLI
jgi:hypothetical protein